ncbi:MAG TPA: hypothetical protein VK717_08040 [Opitutaceae bacterium]|nr:hypothetical protein [Opitutaceae bacterium]
MTESTLQLPTEVETRDDERIARLCRQVCLCRARGQIAEADRLETTLPQHVPPGFSDEDLRQVFFAEQRRVLDALMLVELLGPLLTDRLAVAASGKRAVPAPASGSRGRSAAPAEIADLIESMLQQQRAERGPAV